MELSVVIPAYNREWSLHATVDSVLACGVEAEIIVVDDGSTDRTVEVARSYEPRVKVFTQTNGGPSKGRNTGLEHATGSIIAFLDSDDIWQPNVVPEVLKHLREHPEIDVLVCEASFGSATDGYQPLSPVTGRGEFAKLLTNEIAPRLFKLNRDPFMKLMIERMQVFLGSTFIRRSVLDSISPGGTGFQPVGGTGFQPVGGTGILAGAGPFDPTLFGGEDYELCLRLAARHTFAFLDKPLAQYEKHPGGISTNQERMSREFALAVRSMVRKPDWLTPEERRLVKKKFAQLAFWYGYRAYDRGDFREARTRFAAGLKEGSFSFKTAAMWAACCLPAPAVRLLRRTKQGGK
jgi:glycosyltransferase involved in cell wall biosynthesis